MANRLLGIFPKPAAMQDMSRVYDLKSRLDWGEPALTIIDIRDRALFNESHIMGAISMPMAELLGRVQAALEYDRDIYLYSHTDEEAVQAAQQLRDAGYQKVSVVRGGVAAWKAADFQVETGMATV
ncbi:rhodanese-like domain-containing protein [Leptolyngbya iicbica]|uniref:Rhodanese-like domain-containing protein n=2 Tax=Cyanophyceae TaxID=3028117 RepID=A0A4Q7EG67_9CYAN|nr:rhodanese-like domain-containing protein [Leptolyngbya sp. LK]RZM82844.1 rhodanese-like domain-containing protein [Leptolyngbya sp. LK]